MKIFLGKYLDNSIFFCNFAMSNQGVRDEGNRGLQLKVLMLQIAGLKAENDTINTAKTRIPKRAEPGCDTKKGTLRLTRNFKLMYNS